MKKLNNIATILFIWGLVFIGVGVYLNKDNKPIIINDYKVTVNTRKDVNFRTTELKLKDITTELNKPISLNIFDYIENLEQLDKSIAETLKLDTSEVKINEAGNYKYIISCNKKKYIGNYKINKKEVQNFTIKNLKYEQETVLSTEAKDYINKTLSEEIIKNLTLDISKVDVKKPGTYQYTITYSNNIYTGTIEIYQKEVTTNPTQDILITNTEEKKTN